jgi:glycosyltransferase involved in cell wall biosynthesis
MIGDGPDRGAAEYIVRTKGLTKDVCFLGKQDQVDHKLGLADLFLLPSDEESFGLAALEAMACEVPVIATNVGGLPEVVTNGVDGYLIPPRDVATGARRALEILLLPDRGRAMGQQARINARRKYCSNDVIPQYEAYYEKVLNSAGAAARA